MQLLLFVADKVDTCLRLDIDELLLIGPEIEHLVFKNSTKLQKKFYWVTVFQILSIAIPQVPCIP